MKRTSESIVIKTDISMRCRVDVELRQTRVVRVSCKRGEETRQEWSEGEVIKKIQDLYKKSGCEQREFQRRIMTEWRISPINCSLEERIGLFGGGCGASNSSIDDVKCNLEKENLRIKSLKRKNYRVDEEFLKQHEKLTNAATVSQNMTPGRANEDEEEVEEADISVEMIKLEDLWHTYRRNVSDCVWKYESYLLEEFELYLQYQFLASKDQISDAADLRAAQKQKLIDIKKLLEVQKEKQPTLRLVFYLNMFIQMKDDNLPQQLKNKEDLIKLFTQVKKIALSVYSVGQKAVGVLQGNIQDGLTEVISFGKQIVSLLEEFKGKALFRTLFSIQIERMRFIVDNVTTNKEGNLSSEALFYIQKFNALVLKDKNENQEELWVYLMMRIDWLLTQILTLKIASKAEEDKEKKQDLKTKYKELADIFQPTNDTLNLFVQNLILECQDEGFSDNFKSLISMSVTNYSLRYASLSVQSKLRQILAFNKQTESKLFNHILMNQFRRYLMERESSIKVLLYYDRDFQAIIKATQKDTHEITKTPVENPEDKGHKEKKEKEGADKDTKKDAKKDKKSDDHQKDKKKESKSDDDKSKSKKKEHDDKESHDDKSKEKDHDDKESHDDKSKDKAEGKQSSTAKPKKEKVQSIQIDEKFLADYLEYEKNWKLKIGGVVQSIGDIENIITKVSDITTLIQANMKTATKIIESISETTQPVSS